MKKLILSCLMATALVTLYGCASDEPPARTSTTTTTEETTVVHPVGS